MTLGANAGVESVGLDRFGEWATRSRRIGPSLSLPIFDHGRRRGTVTLRELEQQEAALAFRPTVVRAWNEVDTAVTGYNAERRLGANWRLATTPRATPSR